MNPAYKEIGDGCARQYYESYDSGNLDLLTTMYHDSALLTFEGAQLQGKAAIREKHSLLAGKTRHVITTIDSQPTFGDNGVAVTVVGQIKTEGEEKALGFIHMFLIRPLDGAMFIFNEMFRLALHDM